jgi:hypothetical protein
MSVYTVHLHRRRFRELNLEWVGPLCWVRIVPDELGSVTLKTIAIVPLHHALECRRRPREDPCPSVPRSHVLQRLSVLATAAAGLGGGAEHPARPRK